ncbi:adrenodoxin-like [Argiope bruennichi]|uniref:adrenodoxin-like n=1 Tax=Argiope bruennichi TaxID=94029 RepID=UPI00249451B2|nr:adrenodoxin-like [Argiope bruennichi]
MSFSAVRNLCRGLLNRSYGRLMLQTSASYSQMKSLPLRTSFKASLNINKFRFYSEDGNQWVAITFERHDGTQLKRKGKVGHTIQEVIGQDNPDFPGYGACDGTISCSTCHVILSKDDFQKLGKPSDEEDDTLDLSPCLTDTSRLGCCIELTKEMDGIVVKLPAEVKDMRNNN